MGGIPKTSSKMTGDSSKRHAQENPLACLTHGSGKIHIIYPQEHAFGSMCSFFGVVTWSSANPHRSIDVLPNASIQCICWWRTFLHPQRCGHVWTLLDKSLGDLVVKSKELHVLFHKVDACGCYPSRPHQESEEGKESGETVPCPCKDCP